MRIQGGKQKLNMQFRFDYTKEVMCCIVCVRELPQILLLMKISALFEIEILL